jgi:hypothetical protein
MPQILVPQTIAVAIRLATDTPFGSAAPPVYLSGTFAFALSIIPAQKPTQATPLQDRNRRLRCDAGF